MIGAMVEQMLRDGVKFELSSLGNSTYSFEKDTGEERVSKFSYSLEDLYKDIKHIGNHGGTLPPLPELPPL